MSPVIISTGFPWWRMTLRCASCACHKSQGTPHRFVLGLSFRNVVVMSDMYITFGFALLRHMIHIYFDGPPSLMHVDHAFGRMRHLTKRRYLLKAC